MTDIATWYVVVQMFGLAALPVTAIVFRRLDDRGVFFARVTGLLFPGYVTWLLASLHIVPYGRWSLPAVALVMLTAGLVALKDRVNVIRQEWGAWWRERRFRLLTGEALFTGTFAAWCWIRGYTPDITGTEKFMDMAFINAINRSVFFPPFDPWLSGSTINYYYLGHLIVAGLIRVSGVPATVGFNLATPLLAALTATGVYSIVSNLVARDLSDISSHQTRVPALAGLFAASLCTLFGNLGGALQLFTSVGANGDYNWWNPSRIIPHTINEFPFFSFLLADLHAHVMAIPFGLLVVGLSLELAMTPSVELLWFGGAVKSTDGEESPAGAVSSIRQRRPVAVGVIARPPSLSRPVWCDRRLLVFGFGAIALGALYVLNGWDYPTYALVLVLPLLVRGLVSNETSPSLPLKPLLGWCIALAVASLLSIAPFVTSYHPPTGGVGVVRDRTTVASFLTIYALPLILVGTWLVVSLALRVRANRRTVVLGAVGFIFLATLFAPARLNVLFFSLLAVLLAAELTTRLKPETSSSFVAGLFGVVALLMSVEEVVYLRDVFQGSPEYRMNTVFKLGYVAWLLLSIAGGYCLYAGWRMLRGDLRRVWMAALSVAVAGSLVYPVLATYSKSQHFVRRVGLDGMRYMTTSAPGDAQAIRWLQALPGKPVILEAVGGEYTDFARVSTYTGLPTVVGWEGHEAQWGHLTGSRGRDVATIYSTHDVALARDLLRRYGVRYVVMGTLERATYPVDLNILAQLGQVVFSADGTQVIEIPA